MHLGGSGKGRTWEKSTPFGPALVTRDEFSGGLMTTAVDGEIQQQTPTNDVVFTPEFLVSYISTIITLNPGDVIATSTPGGVAMPRTRNGTCRSASSWSPPSRAWAS